MIMPIQPGPTHGKNNILMLVEPPLPKALPDVMLITPVTTTIKYSKSIHRHPVLSSRDHPLQGMAVLSKMGD